MKTGGLVFKALPLGYDLVLVDSVTGCRNRGTMVRGQQSVEEWRAKAADSVSVVSLPSPPAFQAQKMQRSSVVGLPFCLGLF